MTASTTTPVTAPRATSVRRWTRRVQGARSGRGAGAVVLDVWYAVVSLASVAALALGVASLLGLGFAGADGATPLADGPGPVLLLVALVGGLLSLAERLGPVGVGGAGRAWWLPLPVDRRELLRPEVLRGPALGAAVGATVAPLLPVLLGAAPDGARLVLWAASGAAAGAAAVAVATVVEVRAPRARPLAVLGDSLVLASVVGLAACLLVDVALAPEPGWWLVATLATAAAVLTVVSERGAGSLPGDVLRSRGSAGDRAFVAVLSLDARELGRALASGSRTRRRSLRIRAGGPVRAVLLSDALLLARSPRLLVQAAVAAVVGLAVISGGLAALLVHAGLLVTGLAAAGTGGAGARHAALVPALDRALPLGQSRVRLAHGVAPAALGLAWAAVALVGGALTAGTDPVPWLVVAPAWALALAAATVRAAYRPPPRFSELMVATPMGGVPTTAGTAHGPDVALVATLPTAVALLAGTWTVPLVVAQWLLTAGAVAVATRTHRRSR